MVEVLAEAPGRDLPGKVAVGRRDHADVDAHAGAAAYPLEGLVLENAQDLALRLERHVGDLVE